MYLFLSSGSQEGRYQPGRAGHGPAEPQKGDGKGLEALRMEEQERGGRAEG